MHRSNLRLVAAAALAAIALAACSSSSKTSTTTTPTTVATPATEAPTAAGATPTTATGGTTAKATVSLASSKYGQILVDSNGLTLYLDEKDKPGTPACTGGCLTVWPAVVAPASPTYGAGLTASMFSTVTASDGTKQLAVNGFPLYTFTGKAAGDVSGQGLNGFYVVGADGKKYEQSAQKTSAY